MHRDINPPIEQGSFQRTDERSYGPGLSEALSRRHVTVGLDDNELGHNTWVRIAQPITDPVRLPQCQVAATSPHTNGVHGS
jgi:hypothetical protein